MNDKAQEIRKKALTAYQKKEEAAQLAYGNAAIKIFDWILDNMDNLISESNIYHTDVVSYPNKTEIIETLTNNTFDIEQIIKDLRPHTHSKSLEDIKSRLFECLKLYVCNQPGYSAKIMHDDVDFQWIDNDGHRHAIGGRKCIGLSIAINTRIPIVN